MRDLTGPSVLAEPASSGRLGLPTQAAVLTALTTHMSARGPVTNLAISFCLYLASPPTTSKPTEDPRLPTAELIAAPACLDRPAALSPDLRDLRLGRSRLRNVTDYVTIVHVERASGTVRAPVSADWLLSRGASAMTVPELADLLDVPEDQVRRRLHTPAGRGEWVQPARGLWVPVPPEYRTWGAPPGIELIDGMMRHLDARYYVGWLSAAAIHGASHQAPQVFQVAVDRMVRDRTVGRTRFRFVQRPSAMDLPTIERPTRSGSARVSTSEVTALDVATDPELAGGIDNSATVIIELADNDGFNIATLASLAARFPAASGRRVGYVLEHFTDHDDVAPLHEAVADRSSSPSRLDPTRPASGPVDERWNLYLNRDLEPEA